MITQEFNITKKQYLDAKILHKKLIKIKILKDPNIELNNINKELCNPKFNNIINNHKKYENDILYSEKMINKLNKWKYDPECKFCIENEFVIEATILKEKLPILKKEMKIIKQNCRIV